MAAVTADPVTVLIPEQSVPAPNDTSASELPTPEPSTTSTSAKKKKKKKKKKTKATGVASPETSEATNGFADDDDGEEPMSPATDGGKQDGDLPPTPMSASGVLPLMEGLAASAEERLGATATEEPKIEAEPKVEEGELSATEPAAEEAAPSTEEVKEEQHIETHTKEEVKPGEPTSEFKDDKAEISNEHVAAELPVATIAESRIGSEVTEKPAQPADAVPDTAEHPPTADAPVVDIAGIAEEPTPEEEPKVVEPAETPSLAEQEVIVNEDLAAEPATESALSQTTEAGLGPEAATELAAEEKAEETIAVKKEEEGSKTESAEIETPAPRIGDHETAPVVEETRVVEEMKPVEAEVVPVAEEAEESKEELRVTEDGLEHSSEEKPADISDISVAAPETTEGAKAEETPTGAAPKASTAEHVEAEKPEESVGGKPAEQSPVEVAQETPAKESEETETAETTGPTQGGKVEAVVEETNEKANPEPSEQPSEVTPEPEQVVAGIPEEAPAEGTKAVDVPEAAEVEGGAAEAKTIPEPVVQEEIHPAAESQPETEAEIAPALEPEPVQEVEPVQETSPPDETARSQDGIENAPTVTAEVPEIEKADATKAEAEITPEPVTQEEIDPTPEDVSKAVEPEEHAKGEDEVVEVSHEDAPQGEVAAAEAAVVYAPPAETEAEKLSKEQIVPIVEEAAPQDAVVEEKEHETFEPEAGDKPAEASYAEVVNELAPEEFKVDPLPPSENTENPIDLVPGEPVPKDNVTAESLNDNVKLNKEAYEGTEPNVPTQFSEELKGPETPVLEVNTVAEVADVAEKLYEPTAPEKSEEMAPEAAVPAEDLSKEVSVAPLPASENAENPIQLQPGESIPEAIEAVSVEGHVRLDQEAYESTHPIVPLKLAEERKLDTPIQEVVDTAAKVADAAEELDEPTASEETEEEVSVTALPASENAENPIHLQPGEPIPDTIRAASVEDHVRLDQEAYEATHPLIPVKLAEEERKSDTPIQEVADTAVEVADVAEKLDGPAASEETEEKLSVTPLPASENAENPIQLQPGEPVPEVIEAASIEDHVRLDQEAYEGTHPVVPLKFAGEERKSDTPIQEVADTAAEVADVAEELDEPTASEETEEKFSVTPLPASENAENPIQLQPGEPIPEVIEAISVEDHVRLDQEAYESTHPIVPLKLAEEERKSDTPIQEVADTTAEVADVAEELDEPTASEETEEKFSVTPLPASENAENPIHLQPGEPIPDTIRAASVEDHVRLDQEAYEATHPLIPVKLAEEERKSDTPIQEVADTAVEVADVAEKLDEGAAFEKAEEKTPVSAVRENLSKGISVAPLPTSENAENPIHLQPGETVPEDIKGASVKDHVRLDKEAYEGTQPSVPLKLTEERKSDAPVQEVADTAAEVADVAAHLDGQDESKDLGSTTEFSQEAEQTEESLANSADEPPVDDKTIPVALTEELTAPSPAEEAPKNFDSGIAPAAEQNVTKLVDESTVNKDFAEEIITEPTPQTAHQDVGAKVVSVEEAAEAAEASEGRAGDGSPPTVVVSSPVTDAGKQPSRTVEIVQPTPTESSPEGIRKRKDTSPGRERPTSSGSDIISTRNRNIMATFWHVFFFGWLGGVGRFLSGIFSSKKKKSARNSS